MFVDLTVRYMCILKPALNQSFEYLSCNIYSQKSFNCGGLGWVIIVI